MRVHKRTTKTFDFFHKRGIYFLINERKIVYVGHSINIGNRIISHKKGKRSKKAPLKKWTHFCFFESYCDNLEELEAFYILKHLPIYNLQIPKNSIITNKEYLKLKSKI